MSSSPADLAEAEAAQRTLTALGNDKWNSEGLALVRKLDQSARSTLRVAAFLPGIMAICFLLMVLWFRRRGGYRQVHLD